MRNVKGVVSDIQRYCIHDGPGIRTVVFLKGCPLSCIWCSNPESQDFSPQLFYIPAKCIGCLRCMDACPVNCIAGNSENHINIDRESCTRCFECVKACPSKALVQKGRIFTVDEVVSEVMKDEPFFKTSDGGVTLSGGEVLGQYMFSARILKALKDLDINTAIETSGYGPWSHLESLAGNSDLILYDIKHYDSNVHTRYTGVSNDLIIDNLEKLIKYGSSIVVRLPMIPGFNMDSSSIEGVISLLEKLKVRKVDILPFHQLGKVKYASLGMDYQLKDLSSLKEEEIAGIKKRFKDKGFEISGEI